MPIRTYKDLNVFRESYQLALDVSRATKKFPGSEQFELVKQLRRAVRSVPANIVEGWAKRSSEAEFKRFLAMAIGSCEECKFWLELSRDEDYMTVADHKRFEDRCNVVGAMLKSLWKHWQNFAK